VNDVLFERKEVFISKLQIHNKLRKGEE